MREIEMADRLLKEDDAAKMLGMSVAWMQWKRWKGGGPAFVKFARAVRYKEADLLAWIEQHSGRRNTSDTAAAPQRASAVSR